MYPYMIITAEVVQSFSVAESPALQGRFVDEDPRFWNLSSSRRYRESKSCGATLTRP